MRRRSYSKDRNIRRDEILKLWTQTSSEIIIPEELLDYDIKRRDCIVKTIGEKRDKSIQ